MDTDTIVKTAATVLLIILLGVAAATWLSPIPEAPTARAGAALEFLAGPPDGDIPSVTISAEGLQYVPDPVKLALNQPVEIRMDPAIVGCMRYLVAPQLGLQMSTRSGENIKYAIPRKAGTYSFSCSMNMGTGTIIVE